MCCTLWVGWHRSYHNIKGSPPRKSEAWIGGRLHAGQKPQQHDFRPGSQGRCIAWSMTLYLQQQPPVLLSSPLEERFNVPCTPQFCMTKLQATHTSRCTAAPKQVHRAVSHDGRQLAVKVQHAGLRETAAADVATIEVRPQLRALLQAQAPCMEAQRQHASFGLPCQVWQKRSMLIGRLSESQPRPSDPGCRMERRCWWRR
jgi:hypothetical protein